jgi:carbon storage regulator
MLVFGRKENDKVVITGPGPVVVTVLSIRGDKVRLGFDANEDTEINRGEVQEKIDAQEGGGR